MLDAKHTAITPSLAEVADLLDQAAQHFEADREIAAVLHDARNRLRVLGWNRYAHQQTMAARARVLRLRHTGRCPR